MLLWVEFLTPFTSRLPSYYVPHLSWPSSLGNIVLLFSCSVLLFSVLRLISNPKLWNSCYVPFRVIVLFMLHNRLIIFLFRRYIHSHGYIYERIMYDRTSSYIDYSAPIFANLYSPPSSPVYSGIPPWSPLLRNLGQHNRERVQHISWSQVPSINSGPPDISVYCSAT